MAPPRYVIVAYNGMTDTPVICFRTNNLGEGERKVDELKKGNVDRCVVLYDFENDNVVKVVMLCEPIYLVQAIELARNEWVKLKKAVGFVADIAAKAKASDIITTIAERLSGAHMPGVSSAFMGHILAPYYAVQGDGAAMGGAAAGMYGGLSGAVIGFVVGGPVGAFIGGFIGGTGLGVGTSALIRAACHPNQCSQCEGVGMDESYKRCRRCDGYGHTKGKL